MSVLAGPRLLVLSDLHADDKTFDEPLVNALPTSRASWIDFSDTAGSPRDPLATLEQTIRQHQIRADFVLVPGDICDRANGKALRLAWSRLHAVAALVGGAEVIATVGNHD